jgi:hypothetical protein
MPSLSHFSGVVRSVEHQAPCHISSDGPRNRKRSVLRPTDVGKAAVSPSRFDHRRLFLGGMQPDHFSVGFAQLHELHASLVRISVSPRMDIDYRDGSGCLPGFSLAGALARADLRPALTNGDSRPPHRTCRTCAARLGHQIPLNHVQNIRAESRTRLQRR